MSVKLSHQAAILICVPLLASLIILVFLLDSLDKAAYESERAKHAKEVQTAASALVSAPVEATSTLSSFALTHAPALDKHFQVIVGSIPKRLSRLKRLVQDNAQQMVYFEELESIARKSYENLKRYRELLRPEAALNSAVVDGEELQGEFNTSYTRAADLARKIVDIEAESIDLKTDVARIAYLQMRTAVISGIVFSIILAVILAWSFYQATQKRLHHLMDNARRLSQRQPIAPPLRGEDEFASLDHVFHDMADALAEARRKEIAIIEKAVDVICSISWEGNFTAMNPAVYDLWGWDPDELLGKSYSTLLTQEDKDGTAREFQLARADGLTRSFENTILRKDGSQASMLWSVHSSAEEQSIFCVVHDITDRKEIERLKQDFMSMVSHDLRTPLTSIRLFLEVLREGVYGEMSAAGLAKTSMVDDSVNRLMTMVNDLLDLEKLEVGGVTLYPKPTTFGAIVDRSTEALTGLCHQFGVEVVLSRGAGSKLVVDEDRIVQVLVNLASNAVKFSPRDSTVVIEGTEVGSDFLVKVIDKGPGIPKEHQKTIFERFKQNPDAPSEHKKLGTGLGLHIAMSMVELHGGEIGVESEVGMGSTFWFRLPRELAPSDNPTLKNA